MTPSVDPIAAGLWAAMPASTDRLRGPGGDLVGAQLLIAAAGSAGVAAAVLWSDGVSARVLALTDTLGPAPALTGPEVGWPSALGLRGATVLRGPEGRAAFIAAPIGAADAVAVNLVLELMEAAARRARPDAAAITLATQQRQLTVLNETARLIRGLAHDVRNILNVLTPALELPPEVDSQGHRISAEDRLDELLPSLAEARGATTRLQHVLDRVSSITKAGAAPLVSLNLGDVLFDAEHGLTRAAGLRHSLQLDIAAGLPRVRADEQYLVHMLGELVENAREASAPGGVIVLAAAPLVVRAGEPAPHQRLVPGTWAHITVRDQGSGMTPDNAERYLRAFESSAKARARIGLGMTELAGNKEALKKKINNST